MSSSGNLKVLKSGTHKERILITFLLCFGLVIVALCITIIFLLLKTIDNKNTKLEVCLTAECIYLSQKLLIKMNRSVDPCVNFYEYACGNWMTSNDIPANEQEWTSLILLKNKNLMLMKKALEDDIYNYKGKPSSTFRKIKDMYKICMDLSEREKHGVFPLAKFLLQIGSSTLINGTSWNSSSWNLIKNLVQLHKHGIAALFTLEVHEDDDNSTRYILEFSRSVDTTYIQKQNSEIVWEALKVFFFKVFRPLQSDNNHLQNNINEIVEFEKKLNEFLILGIHTEPAKEMTILQLNNMTEGIIDFKDYLDKMFETDIPLTEKVTVHPLTYFINMIELVQNTTKRILANYFTGFTTLTLASTLNLELLNAYRDFEAVTKNDTDDSLWQSCASEIDKLLGFATGALLVNYDFQDESIEEIRSIFNSMSETFIESLQTISWIDSITREKAIAKMETVIIEIGYPTWMADSKGLDEYYTEIKITGNNFQNFLNAKKFQMQKLLELKSLQRDRRRWKLFPGVADAAHFSLNNQITIPVGIIRSPFYNQLYPMSLKFGGIGMVIAHEVIHGFDSIGCHFDKDGNYIDWWLPETAQNFRDRSECFVAQYDNYSLGSHQVDGDRTLPENIADNGGLRLAFTSYRKWKLKHNDHLVLPGINLTDEQLFFLASAQISCHYIKPDHSEEFLTDDWHSPGEFRVIGTLSNMNEFTEAYHCSVNSPMNPKEKCHLW